MKMRQAGVLLLMCATFAAADIFLIDTPKNINISINSRVRLPCRARSDADDNMTVFWNFDGFTITREGMASFGQSRYSLPGPLERGVFDLEIKAVALKDEGEFQCQVAVLGRDIVKLSPVAKLSVMVAPRPLVFLQVQPARQQNRLGPNGVAWAESGSTLKLLCLAERARPAPTIAWFIDGRRLIAGERGHLRRFRGLISTKTEPEDEDYYSTKSSLFIKLTDKLQHSKIQCSVDNVYPKSFDNSVYTRIEVRKRPKVTITIDGSSSGAIFKEHETITVKCEARGYPEPFTWKWFITQQGERKQLPEVLTAWYRIQLRREMHGATVRCEATNFATEGASLTLNIQYGPAIKDNTGRTHAVTLGESTELRCDVDSNPKSEITWVRGAFTSPVARGAFLRLSNVDSADLGSYTCVAQVPGFQPAQQNFFLGVAGKPNIEPRHPVYGEHGKKAKLVCTIYAIPKPLRHNIRWTKAGLPLLRSDRHHFYQQDFLEGVRSVIFISFIEPSDFGDYNCSASNSLGANWRLISLRRKEQASVTLAIGLGAAAVFIIACLVLIALFVRKSRRKRTRKSDPGYLQGEMRTSEPPPSVYGCGGSTSNDYSGSKEASWLRGDARHSYFHVPSELGEVQGSHHPLQLETSREATLRRIMEWRDEGSPMHPASPHASTTRGSPMHSSLHQATHQFVTDRGPPPPVGQQPSNSDSGISNDNFCSPPVVTTGTAAVTLASARQVSPLTFACPGHHPTSPVRSTGSSNRSNSLVPSPPLPLFSGPRRLYLPTSLGDSCDDTRL